MRWTGLCILGVLAAGVAGAADQPGFDTNQAARLVIGQPSFTAETPSTDPQALGAVGAVAVTADKLLVLDSSRIGAAPVNNRVFIYNNLAGFLPAPTDEPPQGSACPACIGQPDVVLGQTAFNTATKGVESGFNNPTAIATDGVRLAIADTDNNRVLIWRTIPGVNGTLPDVVVGQPDFKGNAPHTDQTGLRGPQGVWFFQGKLLIADTQNGRVLIYNSVPNANGARADVVLGQPDFNTRPAPDLTVSNVKPTAQNMLNPVSATAAGNRLIVTDLGFNRVVIFNAFPSGNYAAADLVVGQPDMTSAFSNNSSKDSPLCPVLRVDTDGTNIFPPRCETTLSFPRVAISDGTRLFVADSGNDRVLIYNQFPTANGAPADVVLGQKDFMDLTEDNGASRMRSPTGLAWDGTNLFISDPFSRRVLVFSPAERLITSDGLVNAASMAVHAQATVTINGTPAEGDTIKLTINGTDYTATSPVQYDLQPLRDDLVHQLNEDPGDPNVYVRPSVLAADYSKGSIRFGGEIQAGDVVTIRIQDRFYSYTVASDDVPNGLVYRFIAIIRDQGHDPDVFADVDATDQSLLRLTAIQPGPPGDNINYAVTVSSGAKITAQVENDYLFGGRFQQQIFLIARTPGADGNNVTYAATTTATGVTVTTAGANLTGGNDASQLPAGTQVAIFGQNLADSSANADLTQDTLPRELAGTRVYINGVRAPLYFVTPTQVNAQVPFEIPGTSLAIYVRTVRSDGRVSVTVPRATSITRASPGLFAGGGPEPRTAMAVHGQDFARGTIAIDSTATDPTTAVPAGAPVEVSINDRKYHYDSVDGDTTDSIRDNLVSLINAGAGDPDVTATAGRAGFLSARAQVKLEGTPKEGDVATVTINGRNYSYTVKKGDNLTTVANRLIGAINAGAGDADVTAQLSTDVGVTAINLQARSIGTDGNSIALSVGTSSGSGVTISTDAKNGTLAGGRTPSVIQLSARRAGRQGDDIRYGAFIPDGNTVTATAQTGNLCCGNDFFAPITPENPAVPGETIVVFGTGLGRTTPDFGQNGLETGRKTPPDDLFKVPLIADDFVSSLAGGRTATVDFVGLMPGQVGVYQVNLILNPDMPDNPMTPLTIAQGLFVSNVVTIPVKNLKPKAPVTP